MKAKQWIYNFNSLDLTQRLEVIKALVEELQKDEKYLSALKNYDDEVAKEIEEFLSKLVNTMGKKLGKNNSQTTLDHYKALSSERKSLVVEAIVAAIQEYHEQQKQDEIDAVCEQIGHVWSNWDYYTWTDYIDTVIDHQEVHGLPVKCQEWSRCCKRCHRVERLGHEPDDLRVKREEKAIQKRIKDLEKELEELKGKSK